MWQGDSVVFLLFRAVISSHGISALYFGLKLCAVRGGNIRLLRCVIVMLRSNIKAQDM